MVCCERCPRLSATWEGRSMTASSRQGESWLRDALSSSHRHGAQCFVYACPLPIHGYQTAGYRAALYRDWLIGRHCLAGRSGSRSNLPMVQVPAAVRLKKSWFRSLALVSRAVTTSRRPGTQQSTAAPAARAADACQAEVMNREHCYLE